VTGQPFGNPVLRQFRNETGRKSRFPDDVQTFNLSGFQPCDDDLYIYGKFAGTLR
jgi:hypothetical protein